MKLKGACGLKEFISLNSEAVYLIETQILHFGKTYKLYSIPNLVVSEGKRKVHFALNIWEKTSLRIVSAREESSHIIKLKSKSYSKYVALWIVQNKTSSKFSRVQRLVFLG